MFQLRQDIDANLKQQILRLFTQYEIKDSSDIWRFQSGKIEQFQKVFQESPEFVLQRLLPKIKKWKLRLFSLIPHEKMSHKMRDLEIRLPQVKLFKRIQHIDFSSVRKLRLEKVQLYSIEPLCLMRLDNLQSLHIQNNFITSLKPLAKFHFPLLTYILISGNPYSDDEYKHLPKVFYSFYPVFFEVSSFQSYIRHQLKIQNKQFFNPINKQLLKLNKKFHSALSIVYTNLKCDDDPVRKALKEKFYNP